MCFSTWKLAATLCDCYWENRSSYWYALSVKMLIPYNNQSISTFAGYCSCNALRQESGKGALHHSVGSPSHPVWRPTEVDMLHNNLTQFKEQYSQVTTDFLRPEFPPSFQTRSWFLQHSQIRLKIPPGFQMRQQRAIRYFLCSRIGHFSRSVRLVT